MQLNRKSGKLPYQWQATLSRACWNWGGSQEWWWRRVREGEATYYAALEAAYECEGRQKMVPEYCKNNNLHKRCSHCSTQCNMCEQCEETSCKQCPNVCEGFSFARGGHPSTPNPCEGWYSNPEDYPLCYECAGCQLLPKGW